MGLVSSDLQNIVNQLDKAKNSINNKYDIMKQNNENAQDNIAHLYIDELSPSIDKIECLNSYDGDLDPNKVLQGTKFYSHGKPVIGTMPINEPIDVTLDINNTSVIIPLGYIEGSQVKIETESKTCMPSSIEQNITPTNGKVLSNVVVSGDSDLVPENIKPGVEIFGVVGNMKSNIGDIKLTKVKPQDTSPSGYYENEIKAEITDFDIVYVTNVENEPAFIETVSCNQSYFNITSSSPTKPGLIFKGWSLSPDGSGTIYSSGQTVQIDGFAKKADTIIFYAAYKENQAPNPLSLQVTYKNNGVLDANNTESVVITLIGGEDPEGGSVTKSLQIDGCYDKIALSDSQYEVKFNKTGFFMAIGTSTDMFGEKSVATELITIKGAGGSSSGSGQFIGTDFDSGWIPEQPLNGCYISSEDYHLRVNTGHYNPNGDTMQVYGRKSDGTEIILWDNFSASNKNLPITTNPGKGNLDNTQWDQKESLTKDLDIRQVKFVATTTSSHSSCVTSATIKFNIELTYDSDLDNNLNQSTHEHTYGTFTQILAPTCTANGKEECMCTSCRGKKYRVIKALGHSSDGGKVTKLATCTSSGLETETCLRCNSIINTKVIAATGHTWDNGVITTKPTTTSTGVKTYTCKTCKATNTEVIPKLESNETTFIPDYDVEVADEKYRWGMYEIKNDTSLDAETRNKYISLYRRIYAAFRWNDYSENGYKITNFSTGNKETKEKGFFKTHTVKINGTTYTLSNSLYISVEDLGITDYSVLAYVWGLVYADCPEILVRWRWTNLDTHFYWGTLSSGVIQYMYLAGWDPTDLANKKGHIRNVLNAINSKIKSVIGLTHKDGPFADKVTLYTSTQKRNIAKIIFDYLVVANQYGDANSGEGYNQILWPAMSYQSSTNVNIYKPVCASYAHAFKYCCWEWGIDAIWVPGQGGEENSRDALHAWNMVNYNSYGPWTPNYHKSEYWQEVDITWGDSGAYFDNKINYFYLNATENSFHNGEDCGGTYKHHYKAYYGKTNYYIEKYKNYPANGRTTCSTNKYSGKTVFGLY